MGSDLLALSGTAIAVGVTHTLLGPDHYVPFVALSRTRNWSIYRTAVITFLCGIGHVLGSVVLGAVGILAGVMVGRLERFEAIRGEIAASLLFAFGTIYMLWGLWRFFHPREHKHAFLHKAGISHSHPHSHSHETHSHDTAVMDDGHSHAHGEAGSAVEATSSTPWGLFIIFVLGPCEPLIPLLMYPASENNFTGALVVAGVFSAATIGTMLAVVMSLYAGISRLELGLLQRLSHFLAGLAIALCGAAILFLGL